MELNCKDLMINDWVHRTGAHNAQVRAIKDTNQGHQAIAIFGNDGWCLDMHGYIQSIPLTKEILEANGFTEHHIDFNTPYYCNDEFPFCLFINSGGFYTERDFTSNIVYGCDTVHEFQHMLRSCGMRELADNLKIE